MCTYIVESVPMAGSAKGQGIWMRVDTAHVAFDHPYHAPFDHALMIDLAPAGGGPGDRIALELEPEAARRLAERILAVLAKDEVVQVLVAQASAAAEATAPERGR